MDGSTLLLIRGIVGAHAFQGVVGIVVGVLTFHWPGVTALALIMFIGAWAIVTGAIEVAAAIKLRRVVAA